MAEYVVKLLMLLLLTIMYFNYKNIVAYSKRSEAIDLVSKHLKDNLGEITLADIHILYNDAMYEYEYYFKHPFYFGSAIKPEYRERLGIVDGSAK